MWSSLFVFFFVCLQLSAKTSKQISMKFSEKVDNGPMNKWLNFGGDPEDTGKTCLGGGMHCPSASVSIWRSFWQQYAGTFLTHGIGASDGPVLRYPVSVYNFFAVVVMVVSDMFRQRGRRRRRRRWRQQSDVGGRAGRGWTESFTRPAVTHPAPAPRRWLWRHRAPVRARQRSQHLDGAARQPVRTVQLPRRRPSSRAAACWWLGRLPSWGKL